MFQKKKMLDSRDREIIRLLYNRGNKPLPGYRIAQKINMSPPGIKPRLDNLHGMGIIKPLEFGAQRNFTREFNNKPRQISAPSRILWGLDLVKKRKKL